MDSGYVGKYLISNEQGRPYNNVVASWFPFASCIGPQRRRIWDMPRILWYSINNSNFDDNVIDLVIQKKLKLVDVDAYVLPICKFILLIKYTVIK